MYMLTSQCVLFIPCYHFANVLGVPDKSWEAQLDHGLLINFEVSALCSYELFPSQTDQITWIEKKENGNQTFSVTYQLKVNFIYQIDHYFNAWNLGCKEVELLLGNSYVIESNIFD